MIRRSVDNSNKHVSIPIQELLLKSFNVFNPFKIAMLIAQTLF